MDILTIKRSIYIQYYILERREDQCKYIMAICRENSCWLTNHLYTVFCNKIIDDEDSYTATNKGADKVHNFYW